ncbi:MAG: VRR-NUC domain-containing protein [Candidatus Desulfaltia sp.]|nr:VRR-NUC domain-containing protein [Candidatus Desulfaltia sp.]
MTGSFLLFRIITKGVRYIDEKKKIYKGFHFTRSSRFCRSRPMDEMTEKYIVTAILKHLKTVPDCFCWKVHGGMYGTAGIPDIICCIGGRFVAFEVKTPSGKLTKLQEITIQRIRKAKGKAYKVSSVEEVISILERLED